MKTFLHPHRHFAELGITCARNHRRTDDRCDDDDVDDDQFELRCRRENPSQIDCYAFSSSRTSTWNLYSWRVRVQHWHLTPPTSLRLKHGNGFLFFLFFVFVLVWYYKFHSLSRQNTRFTRWGTLSKGL